jgi:oligoribonuclease NrnB/cAMP/cGMP phosphodiesterase (DHH superfamily)
MSKTQDKRKQRKEEHAEFLWKDAQLKAALAKTELDLAVETFKDLSKEMTAEQIEATSEQVQIQYKRIEEYLMSEKERYLERLGIQQD